MLGLGSINFNSSNGPVVGVSAADIVDAYDEVMEKKNNYIAVKLANDNNTKKRAGAAVIGANAGLFQMLALSGVYLLAKTFPKLNNPLVDKFIVKNFDKWINMAKKNVPNRSRATQIIVAMYSKALTAMGIGAGLGVAFDFYSTSKNTVVNGRIQNTKAGAEGSWIASGLKSMYSSVTGKLTVKEALQKNDDGSVTVKFKGVGREYKISKKELKDASRAYLTKTNDKGKVSGFDKKFSKGDGDTLAFEVAFEKYCKDVENGVIPKDKNISVSYEKITDDGDILFSDGEANDLYYLLTGNKTHSVELASQKDDNIMNIYSKASISKFVKDYSQNPEKFACEIRLKSAAEKGVNHNNKIELRDKHNKKHNLSTEKSYAVTNLNDKYITISDTSKTRKSFDIPVETLKDNVESINYVELS